MNKTLILFITLFLFVGCSAIKEMDRLVLYYSFDFTKYTSEGFLFTPLEYNGDYESIGVIQTIIYPAVTKKATLTQRYSADERPIMMENYFIENISPQEAIDELYKKAKTMGADAIINFTLSETFYMNGTMRVPGISVRGFAIKRK